MSVKTKQCEKTGKTKYQAQVWYDSEYYGAKTFDSEAWAAGWEKTTLVKAIKGEILPVRERARQRDREAEQRKVEAALDSPLFPIAKRYVAAQASWEKGQHGESRNNDYERVAALAGDMPLRAFDGRDGAKYIRQFTKELYASRGVRVFVNADGKAVLRKPAKAGRPLEDNTVRLLLTALFRLIDWARLELPEDVKFTGPDMAALKKFGWSMPSAHGAPRKEEPDDAEFASILAAAGVNSALGELLQVQDETGCRLSEVRNARGSQVTFFFDSDGQLVGGNLHLANHKTKHKTKKERDVPLSLVAARIFFARKQLFGNGTLFPTLGTSDAVCKMLAAARTAARVDDVLTKDFRRSFANRNKHCVPYVDLVQVLGDSKEVDPENATPGEKVTQEALGHTTLHTTVGYSVLKQEALARTFTNTSRNARVLKLVKELTTKGGAATQQARSARKPAAVLSPVAPTPEVLALARAMGTFDDTFGGE